MTIGELKAALEPLDDALEIEIVARYEDADGDQVEHPFELLAVAAGMDPDTATEFVRFNAAEYAD